MEHSKKTSSQIVKVVPALAAIFLWSSLAALGIRLSAIPAFLLIGCGFILGSLCGLPWWRQWKVRLPQLLLGLYGLFGYHFFLFMALKSGPVVQVNLLNYLWPLLVILLTPLYFKEFHLNKKHLLAAGLGFLGASLIVSGGNLQLDSDQGFLGYVFALAAAFIWATYTLMCRRFPFPTGALGLFCLLSGLLSLLCHGLFESSFRIEMSLVPYLILLGMGPMGAAFFLWDKAVKDADPRVLGGISYLTPLLSTSFIVIATGQALTGTTFFAIFLILASSSLSLL